MPIYYYRCDACANEFERRQRMTDEPVRVCLECGGEVHRVIQPVGVIFRGSGFYITDNRQVSSPTLAPTKETTKAKEESTGGESQTPAESEGPAKSETAVAADKSET